MPRLVIDATAEIDGRPLAVEPVYFPTLVGAYVKAVRGLADVAVVVPDAHRDRLRSLLATQGALDGVSFVGETRDTREDVVLDLTRVHYPSAVRRALRGGNHLPEPVWVISSREDISRAATTLEREDMYVLARVLVIPVARRLAHALRPTPVSPNAVTFASCLFGVSAAVVPFLPGMAWRIGAALCLHLSITLDFTDGYLARLRGTDSPTGYWFDTVMDEVVKFSLFLGMTGLVLRDGPAWGVAAGVVALLLYHVLTANHWLLRAIEKGDVTAARHAEPPRRRPGLAGVARRAWERLNYLDVHLYLVAVALLVGVEAWALALFAGAYLVRFVRMLQVRLRRGASA